MISIQGKGVSSGVGVGPLYFYHRTKTEIPRYTVTDPDAEWHRFKGAQTAAIEQLGELAEKARAEAGDEAAMLFETHQMMAEDLDYEEAISDHINNEKMNAEAAISDTAVQFAAMFAGPCGRCARCIGSHPGDSVRCSAGRYCFGCAGAAGCGRPGTFGNCAAG